MIQHSNGAQMGFFMQATFEALGDLHVWEKLDRCQWLAQKACEWAQYQYRYAVPTRLVEQLLSIQDSPECTAQHKALAAMITAVFTSPVSLVNLSTSDIISNLITLVLRRVSIDVDDALLPSLVECISSLGAHIYYSDQIQDLASELISRLVTVEMQGVAGRDKDPDNCRRSQAIRCLLAGLLGLMRAADDSETVSGDKYVQQDISFSTIPTPQNNVPSQGLPSQGSRRTRVSGEIWYETLSLLCDGDYSVRSDYAHTLVSYLRKEIPKRGDTTDEHGVRRPRPLIEGSPTHQASNIGLLLFGDSATRSLHATHAYLFILATSSSLGISFSSSPSPAYSANGDIPTIGVTVATPQNETGPTNWNCVDLQSSSPSRRSPLARTRKNSNAQRLLESVPEKVSVAASASLSDYALILHVLSAIHEEVPTRGLLVGLPMLMALHEATEIEDETNGASKQRVKVIQELLARVWLVLGRVWECPELVELSEKVCRYLILGMIINEGTKALSTMTMAPTLPSLPEFIAGVLRPAEPVIAFPTSEGDAEVAQWSSVNAEEARAILVSSKSVQEATGLDRQGLLRRFSVKWTVDMALNDCEANYSDTDYRAHPRS